MHGHAFPAPAADGQSHVERTPVAPLGEIASSVWVQQVGRAASPYVHRHIPNGSVELICEIGRAPRVIGPLTAPLVEVIEPGATLVGMRFVPGAFPAVASPPASDLAGLVVDAEHVWGRVAGALGDSIASASSPADALAVLQFHVQRRAAATEHPDPLVSAAVRGLMPGRTTDVASLTAALHVSETQLRRRCRRAVGLGPKTLHRLLRFQGFLALVQQAIAAGRAPADDGLALLALRVGYADQSHLTRECVRLTGRSPRLFLAETQRACACGHDHSASFTPVLRTAAARAAVG